jgi:hypothetical protein
MKVLNCSPPPPFQQPHDGNQSIICDVQSVYDSRNVSVDGNMNTGQNTLSHIRSDTDLLSVTYVNTVVGSTNNCKNLDLTCYIY